MAPGRVGIIAPLAATSESGNASRFEASSPPSAASSMEPRRPPGEPPDSKGVRFHVRQSAMLEQRGERGNADARPQMVEAIKAAQAYVNALNRSPPPPPPSGGSGCKETCCWRWLTAMLLQELQVLRRTVVDAREAYGEQERLFASLDNVPNERDYAALIKRHEDTTNEYQELSLEHPALKHNIETTREALASQHADMMSIEAEVVRLREVLKNEEEKQQDLQKRVRSTEDEVVRTKKAVETLEKEAEEAEKKRTQQQTRMELVIADRAILESQKESLQVKPKAKKGAGKAAAKASPKAASPGPESGGEGSGTEGGKKSKKSKKKT